jgi:hypothetical protein
MSVGGGRDAAPFFAFFGGGSRAALSAACLVVCGGGGAALSPRPDGGRPVSAVAIPHPPRAGVLSPSLGGRRHIMVDNRPVRARPGNYQGETPTRLLVLVATAYCSRMGYVRGASSAAFSLSLGFILASMMGIGSDCSACSRISSRDGGYLEPLWALRLRFPLSGVAYGVAAPYGICPREQRHQDVRSRLNIQVVA